MLTRMERWRQMHRPGGKALRIAVVGITALALAACPFPFGQDGDSTEQTGDADTTGSTTGGGSSAAPDVTLSFDANQAALGDTNARAFGSAPAHETHPSGTDVVLPGNGTGPFTQGYAFTGWNTSSDGTGTGYAAGDTFTVTANTTLYAQWTGGQSDFGAAFAGGDGTAGNPYQIATAWQLYNLGYRSFLESSLSFVQTADIDLGVAPWNEGAGWPGVGSYGIDKFNGGFDGGGYAISNLTINDSRRRAGLFTLVDGAALENIALVNVDIRTDEGWSGSLVGVVDSGPVTTISNSYATGSIVVDDEMFGDAPDDRDPNVGGLVGFAQSVHIVSSFADVQVTSSGITVGGLIGDLDGTGVDDSYAIGDVTGGDTVGGLVGVADAAVTRSYAAGAVTSGTATVGGLVGNVAAGSVAASFYDQDATGRSDTGSGAPTAGADMLKQATFAPGTADDWDFATVWAIDEDTTYPYHQWYAGPKPTP